MKIKSEHLIIVCLGTIGWLLTPKSISKDIPQSHACVVLQSMQTFQRVSPTNFIYTGLAVYSSSSSSNAPTFTPPVFDQLGNSSPAVPLAEAIAQCLEAGFHIERSDANGLILIK